MVSRLLLGTKDAEQRATWMAQPSDGSDDRRGRMRLDEGYTLDAMERVLELVDAPPGHSGSSGFASYPGGRFG